MRCEGAKVLVATDMTVGEDHARVEKRLGCVDRLKRPHPRLGALLVPPPKQGSFAGMLVDSNVTHDHERSASARPA